MTQINDVLVFLWGNDDDQEISQIAADFAQRHDAHLTGCYIYPSMPEGLVRSFAPPQAVRDAYENHASEMARRSRDAFEKGLSGSSVRSSFFSRTGNILELMFSRARCSDVVVIRSQREEAFRNRQMLLNDALIKCGTPFLVIPPDVHKGPTGKRIVVAWNGSREAALAVKTAMTTLRAAETVLVLNVAEEKNDELGIEIDICEHLAHHGVNVEARHVVGEDVLESIDNVADDVMADLTISGAWGHTRLREIVVGGVTRKLLRRSDRAVWMMH